MLTSLSSAWLLFSLDDEICCCSYYNQDCYDCNCIIHRIAAACRFFRHWFRHFVRDCKIRQVAGFKRYVSIFINTVHFFSIAIVFYIIDHNVVWKFIFL